MLASIAQEWKIIRDEAETALELGKGFKYALIVTQYLDADIVTYINTYSSLRN